jgi:hypothetical protein
VRINTGYSTTPAWVAAVSERDDRIPSGLSRLPANHTWRPRDLLALAANPPEPPCIGGLLYPAKRTVLSGETESLKTWFALILAKAELDAGYAVAWADMDAMGAGEVLARLRNLGVPDDAIVERFIYYAPEERLVGDRLDDVCALLRERAIRLFVLDAFNPILNLHGLDPHKTPDIETFWTTVADPIRATGAAPTLLDHVAKNAEGRGGYAYGSERKASGAHVHIGFELKTAFSRGGIGRTQLWTRQDRGGFLPRPVIGTLTVCSDGEHVTYRLGATGSGEFRPTVLMDRVSRYLEGCTVRVSQTAIEGAVRGDDKAKRTAIDVLVAEGYASAMDGPRNSKLIESVRPYREADDDLPDDPGGDPGATPVFRLLSTPSSTPVPPVRGPGWRNDPGERPGSTAVTTYKLGALEQALRGVPDLPDNAPEWERAWRRRKGAQS